MVRHNVGFCRQGHRLDGKNLYVAPKTNTKGCMICRAASSRRWRKNNPNSLNRDTHKERDAAYFGSNREEAIKRDGEKCVECGMTRKKHKEKYDRDITVDHIDGNGRSVPKILKNNKLNNLQTLCLPCHGRKDVGRREHHGRAKLTRQDAEDIRMFYGSGMRCADIHKGYQMVGVKNIWMIVRNINWRETTQ